MKSATNFICKSADQHGHGQVEVREAQVHGEDPGQKHPKKRTVGTQDWLEKIEITMDFPIVDLI